MRDVFKNKDYFNKFIEEEKIRIIKFKSKLINNEVKEERILPVKVKIHDLELGVLIARYSRGDEVSNIKKDFIDLLRNWENVWEPEYYIKNIWLISISILLNVDVLSYLNIKKLLADAGIDDWLYNFLLNRENNEIVEINAPMAFPKTYGKLKEIVYSKDGIADLLKDYLSHEWYRNHKTCGWHDSHKSTQNLYYGYWSIEVGAIAKILNIPDGSLKNEMYYPYDLVHFKE